MVRSRLTSSWPVVSAIIAVCGLLISLMLVGASLLGFGFDWNGPISAALMFIALFSALKAEKLAKSARQKFQVKIAAFAVLGLLLSTAALAVL